MLDESELGTSMEGFALKAEAEGLAVFDLELDAEVVLTDLLRVVEHVEVHLFAWAQ